MKFCSIVDSTVCILRVLDDSIESGGEARYLPTRYNQGGYTERVGMLRFVKKR